MEAVTYTRFKRNLKYYLKQVNDNSEPLIVTTRNTADNVVVISKDNYGSMTETLFIASNPYLMAQYEAIKKFFER